jgi:hypothetical protein
MGWKLYKCRRPTGTQERAEVWRGEEKRDTDPNTKSTSFNGCCEISDVKRKIK